VLALTAVTASCSGDDAEPESAGSPAPAASAPTASEEPAAAGNTNVLIGTIGTPEDPDAFELSLTDSSGEPVTELPAGEYEIQVSDPSEIHNFHLEGADVEETTTVPETGEITWTVELTAGDYTAVCDPHLNMRAEFEVV
jgi:plastocyanin